MNTREELYHMTDKEMARLKVIEKLLEEEISIKDAADVLGLSDRKIKVPKRVNRIPQIISKTEFDMLLSSVDFGPARCRKNIVRDKLIITVLFYTGIRKAELLNLSWNDLNLDNSILIVKSGKGNKDRVIPIHKSLLPLIDAYLTLRLPLKNI